MFSLSPLRRKRHSKKDYTKESSVTWFIVVLILLAVCLVIRTLTANHASSETDKPVKETAVATTASHSEQYTELI